MFRSSWNHFNDYRRTARRPWLGPTQDTIRGRIRLGLGGGGGVRAWVVRVILPHLDLRLDLSDGVMHPILV